jgi:hypothetical protein
MEDAAVRSTKTSLLKYKTNTSDEICIVIYEYTNIKEYISRNPELTI